MGAAAIRPLDTLKAGPNMRSPNQAGAGSIRSLSSLPNVAKPGSMGRTVVTAFSRESGWSRSATRVQFAPPRSMWTSEMPIDEPAPGTPWVGATNWPGGPAATRHLVELGHRRIAIISGPERRLTSRARVDGYRSALAEAGLPFDAELVRYGDFTHGLAHQHALDILSLPERPTAIFAGSDHQALGAYRAAAELGLRVPPTSV